jgi:hypothetical protein
VAAPLPRWAPHRGGPSSLPVETLDKGTVHAAAPTPGHVRWVVAARSGSVSSGSCLVGDSDSILSSSSSARQICIRKDGKPGFGSAKMINQAVPFSQSLSLPPCRRYRMRMWIQSLLAATSCVGGLDPRWWVGSAEELEECWRAHRPHLCCPGKPRILALCSSTLSSSRSL